MKAKINIIFLFLITTSCSLFAQESMPEIGTKWYYSTISMGGPGYRSMEYVKDTIIEEKNCIKLEILNGFYESNRISSSPNAFLLYENKKIYQYIKNYGFHILYDFNVNEGDIIETTLFLNGSSNMSSEVKLKVTSVRDTIINGESLICYDFYTADYVIAEELLGRVDRIDLSGTAVENIGDIRNSFFPVYVGPFDDSSIPSGFRCYVKDDFLLKEPSFKNRDCDWLHTNIEESSAKKSDIKLVMTDDHNFISVLGLNTEKNDFSLYDSSGKIQIRNFISNGELINISSLQRGVYILLVGKNKFKFIKE